MHLLRDPIHHTIAVSAEERAVIDHPLFQRLRRIKQTAFLHLVFPGSTHDRFSHSIGAMHMASLAFDRIVEDFRSTFGPRSITPDQVDYFRRLVRLAALLHDVGHGPFSHSLEGVTSAGKPIHPVRKDLLERSDLPNHWVKERGVKDRKKWLEERTYHEDFTLVILAKMSNPKGYIGGLPAQDIAALLAEWIEPTEEFKDMTKVGPSGKWNAQPVLKALVSGEIDADRMDYLHRDSHYTGVPYGQYDREMLLDNVVWRPDPQRPAQLCVCVRRKALHAFEDFLISRFHMFLQVYSHKTVVGFDIVLENALAESQDFHIEPDLEEYVNWSDEWLLGRILEDRSSKWAACIRDRIPLKYLFTARQDDRKSFHKFIKPYERSSGTTAWYPSLKVKARVSNSKKGHGDVPKLWWRDCVSFLTKGIRGEYPVYLEDRGRIVPMETHSLLLRSDYVRKSEFTHVYCMRGEEAKTIPWIERCGFDVKGRRGQEDFFS
jgi:HD superfamily phosphohydrolase